MDLNLRDLRYFEIAAETEHLASAANAIARSQPALSKAIRRLEQTVGGSLFEKAGRGVRLTATGRVLLQEARRLLASADEALRHVSDFSQGAAGLVRIGSGTVTVSALLPKVCRMLLIEAPRAEVNIEVGPSMDLIHRLRQQKLDIVLGLLPPKSDTSLVGHMIAIDDVVVAARAGHPVFRSKAVTLADLLKYEWVLPSLQAPSRQWIDTLFESYELPKPHVQVEANSVPLLPQLIAGTDLLSFISRHEVGLHSQARLKEVPLHAAVLRRELGVSYRADGYLSPVAKRLMILLEQEAVDAAAVAQSQALPQRRKRSAAT